MIIAKIDTFPLRIPFKPDTQTAASAWGDKGLLVADSLLVRITTDQGLEGWGETYKTELLKVFPIAAVRNVTVMPHCFYDGPGLLAAIHVTAALGTADAMIEWRYFDPEAQLYGGVLTPVNGQISVPQRPGLGLDPNPNVVRDYLRVETDTRAHKVA